MKCCILLKTVYLYFFSIITSDMKKFILIIIATLLTNSIFSQKNTTTEYKLDSIQKLINKEKNNREKSSLILDKISLYLSVVEGNDSILALYDDELLTELENITDKLENSKSKYLQGRAHLYQGRYYTIKKSFQTALTKFEQSLAIYSELDSAKTLGILNFYLGESNLDLGNLRKSVDYYFASVENSEKAFDSIQVMNTYHSLGITYYYLGNYDSSLYAFEKQYNYSIAYKKREDIISRSLSTLGTINYARGNYSKALKYALESLELSESKNDNTGICRGLINVGNIYKDMNSDSLALKYYNDALILLPDNSKKNQSSVYNNIGIIYQNQNNHVLAKQNYIKARKLYKGICQGTHYAVFDKKLKDFVEDDSAKSQTGYSFFINNLTKLEVQSSGSVTRSTLNKVLNKFRQNLTLKYLLVIPAGLRDYTEDESGTPTTDEINEIYRKIISSSRFVFEGSDSADIVRYGQQQNLQELNVYIDSLFPFHVYNDSLVILSVYNGSLVLLFCLQ